MRMLKRIPWLSGLGAVLAAMSLWGVRAGADVLSDQPGSVVIWPKVIADGTRDTLISLTNTGNVLAHAHCEYILGTGVCTQTAGYCGNEIVVPAVAPGLFLSPECPTNTGFTGNRCQITWQTQNFDVDLTRQQPTIWRVSTGREMNSAPYAADACTTFDQAGTKKQQCPGYFFNSILAPPPAGLVGASSTDPTFRGALICIQVDDDGAPLAADYFKGEALIQTVGSNQISQYNSYNVQGLEDSADTGGYIELNGNEYNACPQSLDVTHYGVGVQDLVAGSLGAACTGDTCEVHTQLTFLPCRNDFAAEQGTPFQAAIEAWDEYEQPFSFGRRFDCWGNPDLTQLNYSNVNSSEFFHTRVRNVSSSGICVGGTDPIDPTNLCSDDADCDAGQICAPQSGLLAVVEQFHEVSGTDYAACLQGIDPACSLLGVAVDAANAFATNNENVAGTADTLQRNGRCHDELGTQCNVTSGVALSSDCANPGVCRRQVSLTCSADDDCSGDVANCTGAGVPYACCTGAGAGTCVATDFCYQCMNDEIIFDLP